MCAHVTNSSGTLVWNRDNLTSLHRGRTGLEWNWTETKNVILIPACYNDAIKASIPEVKEIAFIAGKKHITARTLTFQFSQKRAMVDASLIPRQSPFEAIYILVHM